MARTFLGSSTVPLTGIVPAVAVYDPSDANANHVKIIVPVGGTVHVPVVALGDPSIFGTDQAMFNGLTHPEFAVFDDAGTSYISFAHSAAAVASIYTLATGGSRSESISFTETQTKFGGVTSVTPLADDGAALGTTALQWADVFLATGGVVNWANGGATISAVTAGAITVTPTTDTIFANNTGIIVGHTAQIAANGVTCEFQVHGTAPGDASILCVSWSTVAAEAAEIHLGRSKSGTIGTWGILANGDRLGTIGFYGDDGADFNLAGVKVIAEVDGTPALNSIPGSIRILTTPDGGSALVTRVTLASSGKLTIAAVSTPASVAGATGTDSPGALAWSGGVGGSTSIASTGTGGVGAGHDITCGVGGVANSATTASTGGAGGAYAITSGAGGAPAVATVTSTGGAGGAITIKTGAGGAVSLAVSGTATGGAAGLLTVQGGVGGAVTATSGINVGGAGGGVSVIAGAGGAASGATDTGGAGGVVTLTPGAGGTGDTNGKPGYVLVSTGITRRSVQTIDMADAAVTLTLVPGTPVGTLMTSDVLYVDANSVGTEDLLLPPEADLTGIILVIVNTGGETINIQNDAAGAVLTLETGNTAVVTCDGTTLRGVVGVP